jgi:hypothetical protein
MINEHVYQNIFNELEMYLPKGWDRLIVYLEYGNESYSFSFYVKINGNFIKCYDLPGITDEELVRSFERIDKLVLKERSIEKEVWSNMTMIVSSKGEMHTDFDYTDLSQGAYQYKKNWKRRYLA